MWRCAIEPVPRGLERRLMERATAIAPVVPRQALVAGRRPVKVSGHANAVLEATGQVEAPLDSPARRRSRRDRPLRL